MMLVIDFGQFITAADKAILGEDKIKTGPYAGNSRLFRETGQMFPFINQIYRTYGALNTVQE